MSLAIHRTNLLVILSCVAFTGMSRAADTGVLQDSFSSGRSARAEYAKGRDAQTFYVALRVTNESGGLNGSKCVDSGFISWVRKFFYKESRRTALTVSVVGPGETSTSARTIPLFEVSRDEKNPPTCLSDIQTDIQITPFYVADQNSSFTIQSQMVSSKNVDATGAASIVSSATDLLSYAKGSPSAVLTAMVEKGALTSAAAKVDASIQANASEASTEKYTFSLAPWPVSGDWSLQQDQKIFAVKPIIAKSTGIAVDATAVPAIRIELVYQESLLGGGAGKYLPAGKILLVPLVNKDNGNLDSILSEGIEGVKTNQAMAIVDPGAMQSFCRNLHLTLDKFLTNDDSLAARYAVLSSATTLFTAPALSDSINGCFSEAELSRLSVLNAAFKVKDPRADFGNRTRAVQAKTSFLVKALASPSQAALGLPNVSDLANFQVDMPVSIPGLLPTDSHESRLKGEEAIAFLKGSGGFRVACAQSLPLQSTANIALMAQNRSTNKSVAVYVQFGSGDTKGGASATSTSVRRISFYPVEVLQQLLSLPNWPDPDTCPFAS